MEKLPRRCVTVRNEAENQMGKNGKIRDAAEPSAERRDPSVALDRVMQDLARIAFANVLDFARFSPDGSVEIFDYDKAREIGAKVSVITRKVGRGKNAREVRTTSIRMPRNKFSALVRLGEYVGAFKPRRK